MSFYMTTHTPYLRRGRVLPSFSATRRFLRHIRKKFQTFSLLSRRNGRNTTRRAKRVTRLTPFYGRQVTRFYRGSRRIRRPYYKTSFPKRRRRNSRRYTTRFSFAYQTLRPKNKRRTRYVVRRNFRRVRYLSSRPWRHSGQLRSRATQVSARRQALPLCFVHARRHGIAAYVRRYHLVGLYYAYYWRIYTLRRFLDWLKNLYGYQTKDSRYFRVIT